MSHRQEKLSQNLPSMQSSLQEDKKEDDDCASNLTMNDFVKESPSIHTLLVKLPYVLILLNKLKKKKTYKVLYYSGARPRSKLQCTGCSFGRSNEANLPYNKGTKNKNQRQSAGFAALPHRIP